jgi:hypothetical protein
VISRRSRGRCRQWALCVGEQGVYACVCVCIAVRVCVKFVVCRCCAVQDSTGSVVELVDGATDSGSSNTSSFGTTNSAASVGGQCFCKV